MVTLEKIATLLTEYPTSLIFYNKEKKDFLITRHIKLFDATYAYKNHIKEEIDKLSPNLRDYVENSEKYCILFNYENEIKKLRINFTNKHDELASYKKGLYKNFVQALKDNDLYNEWIQLLKEEIAFEYYNWLKHVDLIDVEASHDKYDELIKLLEEYKSYKFEEIIPDKILFNLIQKKYPFSFIVLGNSGITYGIQFYIGYQGLDCFKLLNSENLENINASLFNYLQDMVSLYFNNNYNVDNYFEKNPFKGHPDLSSIHISYGILQYSRIGEAVMIMLTYFLKTVTSFLKRFIQLSALKEAINYPLAEVISDGSAIDLSSDTNVTLPIDIDRDSPIPLDEYNLIVDKTIELKLGSITAFKIDENDRRIRKSAYALMLVNHDDKTIDNIFFKDTTGHYPLKELSMAIQQNIAHYSLPKTILVDSFYDSVFAKILFEKYIESKQIKVKFSKKPLQINDIFNDFDNKVIRDKMYFDDDEDDQTEDYFDLPKA